MSANLIKKGLFEIKNEIFDGTKTGGMLWPTQIIHDFSGKSFKFCCLPYICIVWFLPKWFPFDDCKMLQGQILPFSPFFVDNMLSTNKLWGRHESALANQPSAVSVVVKRGGFYPVSFLHENSRKLTYCWWKKSGSCTSWGEGSWNPIIYRVLSYISGGCLRFLPSTVAPENRSSQKERIVF